MLQLYTQIIVLSDPNCEIENALRSHILNLFTLVLVSMHMKVFIEAFQNLGGMPGTYF